MPSYVCIVDTPVQCVVERMAQLDFRPPCGVIGIRDRFFATDAATRHAPHQLVRRAKYAETLIVRKSNARVTWCHSTHQSCPKARKMLMHLYASIVVTLVAFAGKRKAKANFRFLCGRIGIAGRFSATNAATHDALPNIVHGVAFVAISTVASAYVTNL